MREINDALASNPSPFGLYQVRLGPNQLVVAEISDDAGVVGRWEMYAEDISAVMQTRSGQVYLLCDEDLGRCARQTCDGVFENYAGCSRGGGPALPRYADALELQYGYDTRVLRILESAFEELLMHDLGS